MTLVLLFIRVWKIMVLWMSRRFQLGVGHFNIMLLSVWILLPSFKFFFFFFFGTEVHFLYLTKSCPTLCDPRNCSIRLPCPSLSPGICSNSCPFSQWCHPTILSSVAPSPPALNLSQHQSLFPWVSSLH